VARRWLCAILLAFAAAFGGGAPHQVRTVDVILGSAMREIQAHDVDAGANHAHERVEVGGSGADGCDDLGTTRH
jgi:hypothetical protein